MFPAPVAGEILLSIRDLVTVYRSRGGHSGERDRMLTAVDRVSFRVTAGETLGIVGESGCGKSTLARTILRLVPAESGRVEMGGKSVLELAGADLREFRRAAQVVFQNPYDSLDPRMRIESIVREPLDIHEPGLPRGERTDRARAILEDVGLGREYARRFPHELSGGQRQRVGIARALVTAPYLLICDEPVSSLDISVQAQILGLLEGLREGRGLTMLFISHDVRVVRYLCDRALVLYRGRVMELAGADALFATPLHPYTRLLLASVPSLDPERRSPPAPERDAGDETAAQAFGCPFHPRCPEATDACGKTLPEPREARPGHWTACLRASGYDSAPADDGGSGV